MKNTNFNLNINVNLNDENFNKIKKLWNELCVNYVLYHHFGNYLSLYITIYPEMKKNNYIKKNLMI